MHVTWVSDIFEQLNGVSVYIKNIMPLLKERIQIDLMTGRINGSYNYPIRHLPAFPFFLFKDYDVVIPNFVRIDADVIHVHTAHVLGQYASFLPNKKVVTTHLHPHHLIEGIFGYNPPKWAQSLAWAYTISFFNRFDVVVCQTNATREIFRARGMKSKAVVIPNGMDVSKAIDVAGRPSVDFKKKYGIPGDYALFLGRLDSSKGINWVIDTVKKLSNRTFVVVGEGTLEKEIRGIPNVRFYNRLQGDDKRAAFCDAAMLLMPSVIETEGIVAQEAMLCKTPVLTSDNPVLREVVGRGGIGCRSAGELAENAEMLFWDAGARKELGERGLEEVKKRDIRSSVDSLIALYESM